MPSRFTGKLLRFLFTHLERSTFGERLLWLDRNAGIFQILWRHGNGVSPTPNEDNALFMTWHEEKQRQKPCSPMEAKQRFRVASRKMRLDRLKSWRDIPPSKNFQFWRFPSDDLAYLLRNTDLDTQYGHSKCNNKKNLMVPKDREPLPSVAKMKWWQEAQPQLEQPVQIKQEPVSEPETESELDTYSEPEPEHIIGVKIGPDLDTDSEAEQEMERIIAVKTEPESEPEMEPEVIPETETHPGAVAVKTEPETEQETQPERETEPKTVHEMEVSVDQRKQQQQPPHQDSSASWKRRPRRCPRKHLCCMEP